MAFPSITTKISLSGSSQITQCICDARYSGPNGGPCTFCAANFYCIGNTSTACPASSNSPPGSSIQTQCLCNPGYYGLSGGPCSLCQTNTYCPGAQAIENACPSNSHSPAGLCVFVFLSPPHCPDVKLLLDFIGNDDDNLVLLGVVVVGIFAAGAHFQSFRVSSLWECSCANANLI